MVVARGLRTYAAAGPRAAGQTVARPWRCSHCVLTVVASCCNLLRTAKTSIMTVVEEKSVLRWGKQHELFLRVHGVRKNLRRFAGSEHLNMPLAHRKYREIDICFTRGFLGLSSNTWAWSTLQGTLLRKVDISRYCLCTRACSNAKAAMELCNTATE
jgi:hypothetical protein